MYPEVPAVSVAVEGRPAWSCAACGVTEDVGPDLRCGGVLFCGSCHDLARNIGPCDDIGHVD